MFIDRYCFTDLLAHVVHTDDRWVVCVAIYFVSHAYSVPRWLWFATVSILVIMLGSVLFAVIQVPGVSWTIFGNYAVGVAQVLLAGQLFRHYHNTVVGPGGSCVLTCCHD